MEWSVRLAACRTARGRNTLLFRPAFVSSTSTSTAGTLEQLEPPVPGGHSTHKEVKKGEETDGDDEDDDDDEEEEKEEEEEEEGSDDDGGGDENDDNVMMI